jgi:hypothetical protein
MVAVQLTIFLIMAAGVYRYAGSSLHPAMVMLYSWLFALLLQLPQLVVYEYPVLSFELVLVQTWFIGMFTGGAIIRVPLIAGQRCGAPFSEVRQGRDVIVMLLICITIVFSIIVAGQIAQKGSSVLDMRAMRTEYWDGSDETHDAAGMAKALLRPGVFLLVLMAPMIQNRMLHLAAAVGFLAVAIGESLLAGGRAFIGFCVAGVSLSYLLNQAAEQSSLLYRLKFGSRRSAGWLSLPLWGIFGGVIFFLCFGVFPAVRNPDLTGREDFYLSFETGTTVISPYVRDLSRVTGVDSLTTLAYGTHYATASMMRSNYLLMETDAAEWYLLGGNNFPLFSKVRFQLFGGRTSERDTKDRIAAAQPFGKNPWIGGVADVLIDFGILGGGFFMFLYGAFAGWVYRSFRELRYPEYMVAAAVLSLTLIAFPHSCIIRWSMTTNTLIACVLVGLTRVFGGMLRVRLVAAN